MRIASSAELAFSLVASFLVSALLTSLAIGYARRRNLIDQPGRRRSHVQPTPRGGGIGIVVVALVAFAVEMQLLPRAAFADLCACLCAVALVAIVGWFDDHGGLAARWRFLAHCGAAVIVLAPQVAVLGTTDGNNAAAAFALFGLAAFGLVWSINLHNFMDGIDGLLAWQSLYVFAVLAVCMLAVRMPADSLHLGALGAAVCGFIPFNFPRARIFMGDVGSGAIGLLIGIAVLRQLSVAELDPYTGLIACSAFVTDASCNLGSRMLRGKRWYSAHREHLYQWMVRSGMSHARVGGWYMAWNLLLVTPVLCWINIGLLQPRSAADSGAQVGSGLAAAVLVYMAGALLWIYGKRWCLRKVNSRRDAIA